MADTEIALGEKIKLVGFGDLRGGDITVVKKVLGNEIKKLSERYGDLKEIKIHRKIIHGSGNEIKINLLMDNETFVVEENHHNLYLAISNAFKSLENELKKSYGKK